MQKKKLLDIGCGSTKKEGFIGVDILRKEDVDVIASAVALPFKDNSIDEVYSRRCIQHIENQENAIKEFHRVLKQGSTAKIIVASYRGWLYYHLRNFKNKPYTVFHLYTRARLKKLFETVGFIINETSNIKTPRRLGYDIVVTAKKAIL